MGAILKFSGYIALKWVLFWVYQIFESSENLNWDWSKVNNMDSAIYTFGMLLALPILEIIILCGPFYLALKQKGWIMILVLVLMFVLEFAIGWYATNQQLSTWMIVKILLSVGLFWLFYGKRLEF